MIELTLEVEGVSRDDAERIYINPSYVAIIRPTEDGLSQIQTRGGGFLLVWESPAEVAAMIDAAEAMGPVPEGFRDFLGRLGIPGGT